MLELLRQVAGELVIPLAVANEIGESLLVTAPWVKPQPIRRTRELITTLPLRLHLGEREALALATELNAAFLVDDREARSVAAQLGIQRFGSLWILRQAKEQAIIARVKPALDDLIAGGTYIGKVLYGEFLRQMNEE